MNTHSRSPNSLPLNAIASLDQSQKTKSWMLFKQRSRSPRLSSYALRARPSSFAENEATIFGHDSPYLVSSVAIANTTLWVFKLKYYTQSESFFEVWHSRDFPSSCHRITLIENGILSALFRPIFCEATSRAAWNKWWIRDPRLVSPLAMGTQRSKNCGNTIDWDQWDSWCYLNNMFKPLLHRICDSSSQLAHKPEIQRGFACTKKCKYQTQEYQGCANQTQSLPSMP